MRRRHNASLVCIVDVQAPSTVASRVAVQRLRPVAPNLAIPAQLATRLRPQGPGPA